MSVTTTLEAAAAVVIVTVTSALVTWTVPRKMLRIATVITSTAVVVIIAAPSVARTLSRHMSHSVTIVAHDTTGTVTAAVVSPAVVVAFPVSTESAAAASSSTVIVVAIVVIGVVVIRRVNGGATGSSDVKGLVFSLGFQLDIELNGLVLIESAVAVGFDGFMMNEEIGATVVGLDEAVTLGVVEPRDLAGRSRELGHCR